MVEGGRAGGQILIESREIDQKRVELGIGIGLGHLAFLVPGGGWAVGGAVVGADVVGDNGIEVVHFLNAEFVSSFTCGGTQAFAWTCGKSLPYLPCRLPCRVFLSLDSIKCSAIG